MRRIDSKGFTIIELLVATVTFSLVLLILTGAIVQFNRIYYKGTVNTKTQEAARTLVEEIARNIQFGPKDATYTISSVAAAPPFKYLCAGNNLYVFQLKKVIGEAPTKHGLLVNNTASCSDPGASFNINNPGASFGKARELLGDNMQLVSLDIQPVGTMNYKISAEVAWGSSADFDSSNPDPAKHNCKYSVRFGGQFCAFSRQEVIITPRLN